MTKLFYSFDDGTVVLRKTRNVEQKPKTVRDVLQDMNKDVDDFFNYIDSVIAGE